MQAIQVTIVQEVATVVYKDLGIENAAITKWTALIALPWALQMLFGPLVELNATKRRWILGGQLVIASGLILAALVLNTPNAFGFSLAILGFTAVASALCNIATDGFYLLAMAKDQQAAFAGIQSTCYRLGRLFCTGILVFVVGLLTRPGPIEVRAPGGIHALQGDKVVVLPQAGLRVEGGKIVAEGVGPIQGLRGIQPPIEKGVVTRDVIAPEGTRGLRVGEDGTIQALTPKGTLPIGKLSDAPQTGVVSSAPKDGWEPRLAWSMVLGGGALLYAVGAVYNARAVPRPALDAPAEGPPGETGRNVVRTLWVLALGLGGYFLGNAITRLSAYGLWRTLDGSPDGPLKGWRLGDQSMLVDFHPGPSRGTYVTAPVQPAPSGVVAELTQLVVCLVVVAVSLAMVRRKLRGSEMGEAFGSFIRQRSFAAILAFILFYRFGEAMVSKMSPLFLKDGLDKGGLAIANDQLGLIKGVAGVMGIVCGGILGGILVARWGLKRAIWPMALVMHVPNLLYLWAAYAKPPVAAIYGVDFIDQFGYGFGFAGYMIILQRIAQRGRFRTAHYAIGTGMGALCIALAGAASGVIQSNFGYTGFFWAVMIATIPGMLTLFVVPLEE
ncbi:hypothetical protein EON79_03665 [bacterium]|nr:MAG: hypothetical protein EON79_03665 [bacterium]